MWSYLEIKAERLCNPSHVMLVVYHVPAHVENFPRTVAPKSLAAMVTMATIAHSGLATTVAMATVAMDSMLLW